MSHRSHRSHSSHGSHASHGNHKNTYNATDYGRTWNGGSYTKVVGKDGATNGGAPLTQTITINHRAPLNWSAWTDGNNIAKGSKIADSEAKLKQLRDNINLLKNYKSNVTNTSTTGDYGKTTSYFKPSGNSATNTTYKAADNSFDAGDKVDDYQYDGLRDTVESISQVLGQGATGLPVKNLGDLVVDSDFEAIKIKVDELANLDISGHANHYNSHSNT